MDKFYNWVKVPANLSRLVLGLLACSSAYLAGFAEPLGFSLIGKIDARFSASAVGPLTLFIVGTYFSLRLTWMANSAWDRIADRLFAFAKREQRPVIDYSSLSEFQMDERLAALTREAARLKMLKGFAALLLASAVVIGYFWFSRAFLGASGAIVFLLLSSLSSGIALLAVFGSENLKRESTSQERVLFSEVLSAIARPYDFLAFERASLVSALLVVVVSFNLGLSRAIGLLSADPVCVVTKNTEFQARYYNENQNGFIFSTIEEGKENQFIAKIDPSRIVFIPHANTMEIRGRCQHAG